LLGGALLPFSYSAEALNLGDGETFDEVYQLAADMGGMGFIDSAEADKRHPRIKSIR
jgi:hypothetical protein